MKFTITLVSGTIHRELLQELIIEDATPDTVKVLFKRRKYNEKAQVEETVFELGIAKKTDFVRLGRSL